MCRTSGVSVSYRWQVCTSAPPTFSPVNVLRGMTLPFVRCCWWGCSTVAHTSQECSDNGPQHLCLYITTRKGCVRSVVPAALAGFLGWSCKGQSDAIFPVQASRNVWLCGMLAKTSNVTWLVNMSMWLSIWANDSARNACKICLNNLRTGSCRSARSHAMQFWSLGVCRFVSQG